MKSVSYNDSIGPTWRAWRGQSVAIVNRSTGETARWAAGELARYLAQILGVVPGLSEPAPGQSAIALEVAADAGLSGEGHGFRVDGATLTICSGGELGLAFGVFAFLREACGCSFAGLGPDSEHVPTLDHIEFAPDPRPNEPALPYRGLQCSTVAPLNLELARLDWMIKNGLNYVMYRLAPPGQVADEVDPHTGLRHGAMGSEGLRITAEYFDRELLPHIRRRGLRLDFSHHNFSFWLPPARWGATHPEWFAMRDGKRGGEPRQLSICTTNPDAVAATIDGVLRYLKSHPQLDHVGIVPEDGIGMCECDRCVAEDENPGDVRREWRGHLDPASKNPSKARRYARLLNTVAQAIHPEFPRVRIVGAAYVDLQWPAEDISLHPAIDVWLAVYWRDGARPLAADGTSDLNRFFFDLISRWVRHIGGERLYLYEYYMGMNAQHSLPYPMSAVVATEWPGLRELGVSGATVQCLTQTHQAYGLNLLTFAKAGWSTAIDHGRVLDEFLTGMFGAAAATVQPIYAAWLRAVETFTGVLKPDSRNISHLMRGLAEPWVGAQLAAARQQARNDRERRQIDRLEHYLHYCHGCAKLIEAGEDGIDAALGPVLALMDRPLAEGWIAPAHAQRWRTYVARRHTTKAAP